MPEAQLLSQLAVPEQLCEQSEFLQSWVQVLLLVHVAVQSPPAVHVSWQRALVLQPRVHLAPLHVAVQSVVPEQRLLHVLGEPIGNVGCAIQLRSQVWSWVQLPLPLMKIGGVPPQPKVPAPPPVPPLLLVPPLPLVPPLLVPPLPPAPAVPPLPPCALEPALPPLAGEPPPPAPLVVPSLLGSPPTASVPACDALPPAEPPPSALPPWADVAPWLLAPTASPALPLLPALTAAPLSPASENTAPPLLLQAVAAVAPAPMRNRATSLAFAHGRVMEGSCKLNPMTLSIRLEAGAGVRPENCWAEVGRCSSAAPAKPRHGSRFEHVVVHAAAAHVRELPAERVGHAERLHHGQPQVGAGCAVRSPGARPSRMPVQATDSRANTGSTYFIRDLVLQRSLASGLSCRRGWGRATRGRGIHGWPGTRCVPGVESTDPV